MMPKFAIPLSSCLLGLACAVGGAAASPPASGQDAEFTVVGHGEGPHERTLSAAVYYRDLDLRTKAGRTVLRLRVRRTAAELCHQLRGDDRAAGLAFVCEDEAVEGAAALERAVIAQAGPWTYAAAPAQAAPAQ